MKKTPRACGVSMEIDGRMLFARRVGALFSKMLLGIVPAGI